MGTTDKSIRIVIALVIAALYYFNVIEGTLAYVLMALALIFLLTSFLSFCPLYLPFGISTCNKEKS
ncbi:YgaP family membrane protein [Yeosuana sp.]|uniref:YgaP family membrane protein n=1 Tax=Yeosuana sp. TaxID=2529388 RepID=UPI004054EBD2